MKIITRILLFLVLIAILVIGTQIYGYTALESDFTATDLSPAFNISISSIAQTLINTFSGNYLAAASSLIRGLNVEGELILKNGSFLPLYLPKMEHQISLNGVTIEETIETEAMWLAPRGSHKFNISLLVDKANLPQVVLTLLTNGGNIDISVDSSTSIAGFTITKNSNKSTNIASSLASYAQSSQSNNISIVSYGFSPNPSTLGNSVNASISLSDGTAGIYTLTVIKDIDLAPDETISSSSFNYDGSSANKNVSFIPPSTGSYHLGILYNGTDIWGQPNDSSRLSVTSSTTTTTPFSVSSYGFSTSAIMLGNPVTATISIAGGNAGTYALEIIRDIDLAPDETIGSYSFNHDGYNSNKSISFIPPNAGSYHLGISYAGSDIWAQPNDSSRLSVVNITTTVTTVPLSINTYGFSPNPITLGNFITATISISGGSTGIYALEIIRDIDLAQDETIGSYPFNHDGNITSKNVSFTPSVTGSYHLGLSYDGTSVWGQPNDSSRLHVTSMTTTTTTPFSVVSYGFSPNLITLGTSTTLNITLSGGNANNYTLLLIKDIDFWLDETVNSFAIIYSGTAKTINYSFTPTSKGYYHLELQLNGDTVWSQPNDTSRLNVK